MFYNKRLRSAALLSKPKLNGKTMQEKAERSSIGVRVL